MARMAWAVTVSEEEYSLKTVYMTAILSLLSTVKPCNTGGDHI
jgi:hypothetical protein